MVEVRNEILFGDKQIQMMYLSAQGTLRYIKGPCTVDLVLRDIFKADYEKNIRYYLRERPDMLAKVIGEKEAEDFVLKSICPPRILSSWTQDLSHTSVDAEIIAKVEATVPAESLRATGLYVVQRTRKEFEVPFRIRYYLDFIGKKCSIPFIAPVQRYLKDEIADNHNANEYLLPEMGPEDFPDAARRMLEMYYPEALTEPTAVDGRTLAIRMKLKVCFMYRLPPKSNIMGKIYFKEDWVKCDQGEGFFGYYKIEPMSILINRELCKTPEMINSVIIHECCHYFLDMPFFSLQMLAGQPFQTHVSKKNETEGRTFDTNDPIERMEWQAEKLPAYVLMEETNTRKEIKKYISEHGEDRSPEGMRQLIKKLAEVFKVPFSMAKDRLIKLGYPEADGINKTINGKLIPDHGCAGPWRQEITYTVSRTDAARMMIEDPGFSRAVCSGLYTYAEGHFCLDDGMCVYKDRNGEKRLTAYARRHIEECCLAFRKPGENIKVTYLNGQAEKHAPTAGILQTRHTLDSEPESKERIRQNRQFCNDAMLWAEVKRTMPDGIKEAVFTLMRRKGITQEEIGMRLGVSRTAFAKWFKKGISLRHVVAICIAMDVRVDVSLEFVKLAGYAFMNTEEHSLLLSFLFETEALNVARANEMLREKGMKPLTEGQSEELAEAS